MIKNRYSGEDIGAIEDIRAGKIKDLIEANLEGADLEDANLIGANLRDADLEDADLEGANLRDANLEDADLEGANLIGANLREANLRGANLRGAVLRGADLKDANLRGVVLRGADLKDANLRGANLIGANLIGAKQLYNCNISVIKYNHNIYHQSLIGSRGRTITYIPHHDVMWVGCFKGTKEECIKAINDKYKKDHKINKEYMAIIEHFESLETIRNGSTKKSYRRDGVNAKGKQCIC